MRVTAARKHQTRRAIVDAALKLFRDKGFDRTTTRDIAARAGIATGTLFNYFPSKEAVALDSVRTALNAAEDDFRSVAAGGETLEERLFAFIMVGLHRLKPHRGYLGSALETALSPFASAGRSEPAEAIRLQQLEAVREMIAGDEGMPAGVPTPLQMHLYWILYLGVLAFWSADDSPHQEATLALLDESTRLFVASLGQPALESQPPGKENAHAAFNR